MKISIRNIFMDLVILIAVLSQTSASIWVNTNTSENNTNILEEWQDIDRLFKDTASSLIKIVMPSFLESSSRLNLSSECMKQSLQLVAGLKSMKTWAFSMVDASAKIPEGLTSGTVSHFGNYDQCLNILVPNPQNKNQMQFQGQYCLAHIWFPLPPKAKTYDWHDQLEELKNFSGSEFLNLMAKKAHLNYNFPQNIGLCIPSGCSLEDLKKLIHDQIGKYHFVSDVSHCEVRKEEIHFNVGQVIAITVCFILGSMVALGTLLEMKSKAEINKNRSVGHRIVMSFSVITNFQKLTSTKRSMENLSCLHGIRFLTVTWVVLAHTYFYPAVFMSRYQSIWTGYDLISGILPQVVANGSECVDVFLFMGGMLLSYFSLKHVKVDGKKYNVKALILHRIWRIAPAYYFVVLCGMLTPLLGAGPMFQDTMETIIHPCYDYWWRNFLFIHTFFPMREMCMWHFWYVACDMQLFLVSILVLIVLIRSDRAGLAIIGLTIVTSIIYSGLVTYMLDIMPNIRIAYEDPEEISKFLLHTYGSMVSRAGPYFIGLLTGYILVTHPDIKISKTIQRAGWCVATASSGIVIFITSAWYKVYTPSTFELALYGAFYKVAFTSGIAWMVYCCITGRAGFINKFLSWKFWAPLSKLCFVIYMIHPYIQTSYIANFRTVQDGNHFPFMIQFFGYLTITTLLSIIISLLVESPFMALEKVLFRTDEKKMENVNGENNKTFQNGDMVVKKHEESIAMREA